MLSLLLFLAIPAGGAVIVKGHETLDSTTGAVTNHHDTLDL